MWQTIWYLMQFTYNCPKIIRHNYSYQLKGLGQISPSRGIYERKVAGNTLTGSRYTRIPHHHSPQGPSLIIVQVITSDGLS